MTKSADEQRQDRVNELRRNQETLRDRAAGLAAVAAHVETFNPTTERYRTDAVQVANRLRKDAETLVDRADALQQQVERILDNIASAVAIRHQERRDAESPTAVR